MELEASLGYASLSQKKKGRLPWPKDLNIVFLSMKGRSRLYDGLLWAQDRQTGNLLPEHQSCKLCPPPPSRNILCLYPLVSGIFTVSFLTAWFFL